MNLIGKRQNNLRQTPRQESLRGITIARTLEQFQHGSLGGDHCHGDHIFNSAPIQNTACARRIIANHASQGCVATGCDIGSKHHAMRAKRRVELIKRHSRLHRDGAGGHIYFAYTAATRAHVHHQRLVHALPGQTCSTASWQHWNISRSAIAHNVNGAFGSIENHHANWFDLIHACVGGVQHAIVFFKTHLTHVHISQIIDGVLAQLRESGEHWQMNRRCGIRNRLIVDLLQDDTILVGLLASGIDFNPTFGSGICFGCQKFQATA